MEFLTARELHIIRGKVLVGKASVDEMRSVFAHLDSLELWLAEQEEDDTFGTEGWRHAADLPDAD